jgi:hypothetical protein
MPNMSRLLRAIFKRSMAGHMIALQALWRERVFPLE